MIDQTATALYEEHGDVGILSVAGEIDIATADELRSAFDRVPFDGSVGIVIDLSAVTYLDSCGVRLLFELYRLAGAASLSIVVPETSFIRRVLLLVDVPSVMPLYESLDAARTAIRAIA